MKTLKNSKGELKKHDPYWILNPTKQPYNLQGIADSDYLALLSPEEAKWLCDFTDAFYTGARNQVSDDWTPEEVKESQARGNSRRRDVYNCSTPVLEKHTDEFSTKKIAKPTKKRPKND